MSVQCIHTMYTFGVTDLDSWCQHAIAFWVWEDKARPQITINHLAMWNHKHGKQGIHTV